MATATTREVAGKPQVPRPNLKRKLELLRNNLAVRVLPCTMLTVRGVLAEDAVLNCFAQPLLFTFMCPRVSCFYRENNRKALQPEVYLQPGSAVFSSTWYAGLPAQTPAASCASTHDGSVAGGCRFSVICI